MKKIFASIVVSVMALAIFVVVLFSLITSCDSQIPDPVDEVQVIMNRKALDNAMNDGIFDKVVEFKYEGHEYIWFQHNYGYADGHDGGIVHNPYCKHPDHEKLK